MSVKVIVDGIIRSRRFKVIERYFKFLWYKEVVTFESVDKNTQEFDHSNKTIVYIFPVVSLLRKVVLSFEPVDKILRQNQHYYLGGAVCQQNSRLTNFFLLFFLSHDKNKGACWIKQ